MRKILLLFSLSVAGVFVFTACGGPPAVPVEEEAPAEAPTDTPVSPEPTDEPAAEDEATEAESGAESRPASDIRTYAVDPAASKASYIVDEEFFGGALDRLGIEPGLVDTIGSTQEVSGELQLDYGNPESPVVGGNFAVDLSTLTSDQPRRDNRIREANLESNKFPIADFVITTIDNAPASFNDGDEISFQANGDITIREITQPTTFDVTARLDGDTISGVASTRLKMTDFGFDPPNFANMFAVEDEFTTQVEFSMKEQ